MIAGFMALAFSLIAIFFGGGQRGHHQNQQNNQANNPPLNQPDDQTKATIPTPALLPGLIGLGVATLRKRKMEKDEANV